MADAETDTTEEEEVPRGMEVRDPREPKKKTKKKSSLSFTRNLGRSITEPAIQNVSFEVEKQLRSRGLGVFEEDPLFGPTKQTAREATRLQQPLLLAAGDKPAGQRTSAPLMPPTVKRAFEEVGLADAIPQWREQFGQQADHIARDHEKVAAMVSSINRSENYRNQLMRKLEANELSEDGKIRAQIALGLYEGLKDKGGLQGVPAGQVSTLLESAYLEEMRLGPKGVRVSLLNDPETGRPLINVPEIFNALQQSYLDEIVRERGPGTAEDRAEYLKEATREAGRDILRAAGASRNVAFFDPLDPAKLKEIAESPGPIRSMKAFFRRRTDTEPFSPRLKDLERESPLDFIFRMGPFDYAAPQLKLVREYLEENDFADDPVAVTMASAFSFAPLGISEGALQRLGFTPQDQVEAYLEGPLFMEEGRQFLAMWAKEAALARGDTESQAEAVKETALDSKVVTAAAFIPYLLEPDAITVGLLGAGYGASKAFKTRRTRNLQKQQEQVRRIVTESEDAASAMEALKKLDPVLGELYRMHVLTETGQKIDRNVDVTAEALQARQKTRDKAFENLQEGTQTFLGKFFRDEDLNAEEIAAGIAALRREPADKIEEALEAVRVDFTDSINARAKLTEDIKDARKTERQVEGDYYRLVDLLDRRNRAEKAFEDIVKRTLGPEGIMAGDQVLWAIETQLQQLLSMQRFYSQLTKKGADEAEINRALERMVFAYDAPKGVRAPKGVLVGKEGETTTALLDPLGRSIDNLTVPELKAILTNQEISPAGANKAELVQKVRDTLGITQGRADEIIKGLKKRIKELQRHQQDAIRTIGPDRTKKLKEIRAKLNTEGDKYIRAMRQLPYGSEARLTTLSEEAAKLAQAQVDLARMAPALDRQIVNAYTIYRAYDPTAASKKLLRGALRATGTAKGAKAVPLSATAQAAAEAFQASNRLKNLPDILQTTDAETKAIGKLLAKAVKSEERVIEAQKARDWREIVTRVANRIDADLAKIDGDLAKYVRRKSGLDMEGLERGIRQAVENISPRLTIGDDGVPVLTVENFRRMETDLVKRFGRDVVDFAFRRSGAASDALSRAKKGKTVTLSSEELEELQTTLPRVLSAMAIREAQGGGYNMAIAVLRSQAQAPLTDVKGWFRRSIETFLRVWDPFRGRVGAASADVNRILSASENYTNQIREELVLLIRQAGKDRLPTTTPKEGGPSFAKVISQYFDGGKSLPLPNGRHTILNTGTPLYQSFRRQVIGARVLDDVDDGALGAAISRAESGNLDNISGTMKDLIDELDPSVLGFSRAWLPANVELSGAVAEVAGLYREAQKIIRQSDTFEEAVDKMKKATFRVFGKTDSRASRGYAFSAYAVGLGATKEAAIPLARGASGGHLTPEEIADVNALLGGPLGYKDVKDLDRALDIMTEMGIPLTSSSLRREVSSATGKANAASKRLVRLGTDKSGRDVFTLSTVRDEINAALNGSIKELNRMTTGAEDQVVSWFLGLLQRFHSLWKQSATTGLVIPNAGYITYVRIGDMSQLYMTNGGKFASRATLRNVWSDIPWIGRPLQDYAQRMAEKTGKPTLRSGLETAFSPHVSDFLSGEAKFFRLPSGELVEADFLRRRMVQDGIMDTFVSEALEETIRNVGRAEIDALGLPGHHAKRLYREWSASIRDFSVQTQQRQRVGTWLLHIADGKSMKEATQLTQEALYDWGHAIAKWEQRYIAKLFPFWRYWRLSMNQTMNAITQPFMNPMKGDYAKALYGNTRMNRFRVLVRSQLDLSPMLADPRTPEEIMEEEGYRAALGKALYPKWAFGNAQTGNSALDLYNQEFYRKIGAGKVTREIKLAAMYHGYDQAETLLLPIITIMGIALELNGETAAADDLWQKSTGVVLEKLFPNYRDLLDPSRQMKAPNEMVKIRPAEAWMIQRFNAMPGPDVGQIIRDPETGQYQATAATRFAIRNLPIIGMELPRLLNAAYFKNPEIQRDVSEGVKKFMLEYTRFTRSYQYNPDKQMEYTAKPGVKSLRALEKRVGYLTPGQTGFDQSE